MSDARMYPQIFEISNLRKKNYKDIFSSTV